MREEGGRLQRVLEERIVSRGNRKPVIAVPMANSEEILGCIAEVIARELADFRLVGDAEAIQECAGLSGVSLGEAHLIGAEGEVDACNRAARLAATGEADALMKGLVQTADFTRAILNHDNGLLERGQLISHVAVLDIPAYHKLLIVTDAAINVAPDVEEKILLAQNAVAVARSIGIRAPKIACVAPAERPSSRVPSTLDAQEIQTRFAAGAIANALGEVEIDGPFGLDVAVSREAAAIKGIGGPVAGDADILLMPNLESGNVLYKSLTYFAGAHAAAIVAGARIPVVLTSRADSERNKFCSVLLALAGVGSGVTSRS